MGENNGDGERISGAGQERIEIVFTRSPYSVSLTAPGVELHMAVAVMRTALDELDAQLRMMRVAQVQQAQADAALSRQLFGPQKGVRQ